MQGITGFGATAGAKAKQAAWGVAEKSRKVFPAHGRFGDFDQCGFGHKLLENLSGLLQTVAIIAENRCRLTQGELRRCPPCFGCLADNTIHLDAYLFMGFRLQASECARKADLFRNDIAGVPTMNLTDG